MFERTKYNLLKARYQLTRFGLGTLFFLKKIYTLQIFALLIVGGTLLVTFTMYAAPNSVFMYQGRLIATSTDVPASNGTYYFKLKIYNNGSGGNANCVWASGSVTDSTGSITNNCAEALSTSTIQVAVNRGTFVIPVGDTGITGGKMPDISNLDFKQNTYYLGVTVCGSGTDATTACAGNPAEMTPLLSLSSQAGQALSVVRSLQANTFNQVPGTYATVQDNPLSNSATTVTVAANATGSYPESGTLLIDDEVMTYNGKTSNQFTGVVRARQGTAAATHNQGATVKTYLFSGAASATTRPVFHITSDGATFINTNVFPIPSQLGFQTDGTIGYALGNDRLGNNYFNIRAGSLDNFSVPTLLNIRVDASPTGTFSLHNIYGRSATLTASTQSDTYSAVQINQGIVTIAGANINTLDTVRINRPTIIAGQAVTDASTFTLSGPPSRSSGTIANAHGLMISSAVVGVVTNAYGLSVATPTGTTNNYTAMFTGGNVGIGTTTPITQLHVPGSLPSAALGSVSIGAGSWVTVQGRYAYATDRTGKKFYIIDVSNPSSPTIVNGTGTTTADEAQRVFVAGNYAYVATVITDRFQIFDISNPTTVPAALSTTAVSGISDIYVHGKYAYILASSNFLIYDISNPRIPTLLSTTSTGTSPNSLFLAVQGRYAYEVNYTTNNFKIIDISSVVFPSVVATISTGDGSNPNDIAVQGRYAYVVYNSTNLLQVFDISNPSSVQTLGSIATQTGPVGVSVQGRYASITSTGNNKLEVVDVSNPSSLQSVGNVGTGSFPLRPFISGRHAFVSSYTSGLMQVFDMGGSYIQQVETGGLEIARGQVRSNFTINNDLDVRSGVNIGMGGLYSAGPLTIAGIELPSLGSMLDIRNSAGTPLFKITNDGFVMLGFELTSGNSLSFANGAARTIGVEASAGAGQNLTFRSGGSGTGNNLAGGDIPLTSGSSRGSGISKLIVQTPQNQTSSGSTANTAAAMFEFANGHIASLALSSVPSLSGCGTGSSIATGSNDIAGRVTLGSGVAASGCQITFARTYATAPTCQMLYQGTVSTMNMFIGSSATSSATFKFSQTPPSSGASKTEPGNTQTNINSISSVVTPGTYDLTLTITGASAPYNFQYSWGGANSQSFSGYPSSTQITLNGGNQGTLTFTTTNTPPSFGSTPVTLTDQVTVSTQSFSYFCIANGEQ